MVAIAVSQYIFRWGMQAALAMMIVGIIVLLVALITLLDVRREGRISREGLEKQALLLGDHLNDMLGPTLYSSDVAAMRNIAEQVTDQPEIDFMRIIAPGGRLLADTRQGRYPVGVADVDLPRGATFDLRGDRLLLNSPISVGPDTIGGLQIGFNDAVLGARINEIILHHILQGLLLIAMGAALSFVLARYFVRPVQKLVQAAKEIGGGTFCFSAERDRGDEIGELGLAFEEMSRKLGDQTGQLQRTNGRLEIEVQERISAEFSLREVNAGLEQRVGERTRELEVISEVGRVITSDPDIVRVYERFTAEVKRLVDFERMSIHLLVRGSTDITVEYRYPPTAGTSGVKASLRGSISAHAVKTGRSVMQDDLEKGSMFPSLNQLLDEGIRSSIAVPLISNGSVVGTFFLAHRQPSVYGAAEQRVLERLASQVASAMENSRLYEELQESLQDQASISLQLQGELAPSA